MTAPTPRLNVEGFPRGLAEVAHDADCLCRWTCHKPRYVECLIASGVDHPDHRVPECPSTRKPEHGDTATCRTCREAIVWETVEEPGYLPRTGWSDQAHRDALVCFRSHDYQHVPDRWPPEATQ